MISVLGPLQESIIKRDIKVHGIDFELFKKIDLPFNQFEYDKEPIVLKGLYHEERQHVNRSDGNTTVNLQKFASCILVDIDTLKKIPLKDNKTEYIETDEKIKFNGKEYIVIDVRNYYNSNAIFDVYMEEVL